MNLHADHDDHGPKNHDICRLSGSQEILQDPDVEPAPPSVNLSSIPVPSIYVDERGEIFNLAPGQKQRINILYTRKGVMRSGDIHKNTQHDFIFSGQVLVWILDKNGTTQKKLYGQHQYIEIPPFTPHIFEFLQDSVIAEWWTPQGFYAFPLLSYIHPSPL